MNKKKVIYIYIYICKIWTCIIVSIYFDSREREDRSDPKEKNKNHCKRTRKERKGKGTRTDNVDLIILYVKNRRIE